MPSGSGCGKLAGRPGTSRKRLHGLGRNSAQQWQCPDPPQLQEGCRVNERKGTMGFLSQETLSLCPVCYEAVAWPTGTGSGGGVPHPLPMVGLDSLAPTRASLPGSAIRPSGPDLSIYQKPHKYPTATTEEIEPYSSILQVPSPITAHH